MVGRSLFLSLVFCLSSLFIGNGWTQAHDCIGENARPNKHFVSTDLNLRSNPGRWSDVLVTLPEGEIVYAYNIYQGWSQVNVASLNVTGWVATRFLTKSCVSGGGLDRASLSRASVVQMLISQSRASYSGSCPCPYNVDRGGRRCGGRSAYSRPGGRSPICYASDVSNAMVDRFRASR